LIRFNKYKKGFLAAFFFFFIDIILFCYSKITNFNSTYKFGVDFGSGKSILLSLLFLLGYCLIFGIYRKSIKTNKGLFYRIKNNFLNKL